MFLILSSTAFTATRSHREEKKVWFLKNVPHFQFFQTFVNLEIDFVSTLTNIFDKLSIH